MASAEISRGAVEVTLRLSEDEAQFLLFILAGIGGDPDRSPRRHQRAISNALSLGLPRTPSYGLWRALRDGTGFYFHNDDTGAEVTAHKYAAPA